ncbi:MAG: methyltransferase domain-containing protein [Candidatus Aenigmatarchaeota archaeon]|nr:methyltransferase domain-containing protein [Candidatus Aenigmarchaeota archaeon]
MRIKPKQQILLLGPKSYLVRAEGRFDCEYGSVQLDKLVGKAFGTKIKIDKYNFSIVQPTVTDFLFKLAKRAPQVILPKDAATILAVTGIGRDAVVVDAGTGSSFLSLFLANYVGKIYTYEKKKEFYKLASRNIKNSGLKNISIKLADISKGIKERNVDLITLDLEGPEKIIKLAEKALKAGGWLVVYCLHVEEVQAVCRELTKRSFTEPRIVENLQRNWQIHVGKRTWTRPKSVMLGHTGFLVFARKI